MDIEFDTADESSFVEIDEFRKLHGDMHVLLAEEVRLSDSHIRDKKSAE